MAAVHKNFRCLCSRRYASRHRSWAFNLAAEAVSALSKLNASLDFDPY